MALAISQVRPKQRGFSRCLDLGSGPYQAIKKGIGNRRSQNSLLVFIYTPSFLTSSL
jgi:hypothetical protein